MARRVVITALGMQTSLGQTPEEILASFKSNRTSFERFAPVADVVVCPIKQFDLQSITGRFKNRRYLNRGAAFGVAAALAALNQSGLTKEQLSAAGLFVGTGPNLDLQNDPPRGLDGNIAWQKTSALWLLKFIANTSAAVISQLAGINGESLSIQTACTAGLAAIGEAFFKVKHGALELALAGAGDSRLSLGGIMAYRKAQALFNGKLEPDQASRPFDQARDGFVSGEGGAFFLLESLEHARRRNATILAEIKGFGASMDAHGMTAPEPLGTHSEKAVRKALRQAQLAPEDIQAVSAHGTGTPINDEVEAKVLERVFGQKGPFVLGFKSWIGHLSAACGAAELALALVCLNENYWPRIRNLTEPCSQKINFVQNDLAAPVKRVLLENFGFGGQNCAMIVENWR